METKLEDLRKWFGKGKKGDWVRVGTDGEIKGDCAREPGEGKPKCMPRSKAHSMSKKDRASSARRKRRADPNPDRPGTGNKPIMVKTDKKESVDMNEKASHDEIMKDINDFLRNNDGSGVAGMSRRLEKKYGIGPAQARSMIKTALQKVKALPRTGPKKMGRFPHMKESVELDERFKVGDKVKAKKGSQAGSFRQYETKVGTIVKDYKDGDFKVNFGGSNDASIAGKDLVKESVNEESRLKFGDKVKTPQGTVEIKKRDTRGMRGKQDDYEMVLTMKDGKKVSMGSHPQPTATAVTNIAKRHFSKGIPKYFSHMTIESIEEKRDASKSATGYDIYHDTYSAAMQHAYAHAKKKHGVTVRPSEIDDKVASGPRKPSNGKTVSHILKTDKKQNLHVQVYNTGRKYELNMYVESVELEENAVELARDVVKNKGAKKGLDMQTANAILTVYDKVSDANKKKMEKMPVDKLANAVWKILGKAR